MKFIYKIAHLLLPGESNNHKARILHSSSLTLLASFLIFYQALLTFLPKLGPRVLGYAANISPSEVIRLTNEKRAQAGLGPLEENPPLSQAAQAKGADMLNKGYWAHFAPDGTSPWKFFLDFGYKYRFAGENLARDFSSPAGAVDAWMASPTHKENILSANYKEVGIGVIEGNLAGVETTIIVQFFGARYGEVVPSVPIAKAQAATTETTLPLPTATPRPAVATPLPSVLPSPAPLVFVAAAPTPQPPRYQVLISPFQSTRNISLLILGFLLLVLLVDWVLVSRRRIVRIGGRAFAHLAYFGMILAVLLILKAGQIL